MAEKRELLSRQGVYSASELEEAIREGGVTEPPSWEDLIVIENLEEKIKKLDKEIGECRAKCIISRW